MEAPPPMTFIYTVAQARAILGVSIVADVFTFLGILMGPMVSIYKIKKDPKTAADYTKNLCVGFLAHMYALVGHALNVWTYNPVVHGTDLGWLLVYGIGAISEVVFSYVVYTALRSLDEQRSLGEQRFRGVRRWVLFIFCVTVGTIAIIIIMSLSYAHGKPRVKYVGTTSVSVSVQSMFFMFYDARILWLYHVIPDMSFWSQVFSFTGAIFALVYATQVKQKFAIIRNSIGIVTYFVIMVVLGRYYLSRPTLPYAQYVAATATFFRACSQRIHALLHRVDPRAPLVDALSFLSRIFLSYLQGRRPACMIGSGAC